MKRELSLAMRAAVTSMSRMMWRANKRFKVLCDKTSMPRGLSTSFNQDSTGRLSS